MKSLILGLAASVALLAAPALAHDPKAAVDAASPKPMAEMTDTELHAHCKGLMGHKMDGRVPHDHSVEKLGTPRRRRSRSRPPRCRLNTTNARPSWPRRQRA